MRPSSHASFALRASPVSWSLGCVRWVGGGVEGWGGVRLITFNVCWVQKWRCAIDLCFYTCHQKWCYASDLCFSICHLKWCYPIDLGIAFRLGPEIILMLLYWSLLRRLPSEVMLRYWPLLWHLPSEVMLRYWSLLRHVPSEVMRRYWSMPQEFAEVGRRQQIVSQSDLGFYGSKQFLAMRKRALPTSMCVYRGGWKQEPWGYQVPLSAATV